MKNFSEIYLEKNKEYFLGFENNYNLKKKLIIKEKFAFARPPTGGMNSSRGGGTCPECDTGEESWGSPRGIAGCGCRKILTPQEQIEINLLKSYSEVIVGKTCKEVNKNTDCDYNYTNKEEIIQTGRCNTSCKKEEKIRMWKELDKKTPNSYIDHVAVGNDNKNYNVCLKPKSSNMSKTCPDPSTRLKDEDHGSREINCDKYDGDCGKINCIGDWSKCNTDCEKVYKIIKKKEGS